MSLELPSGSSFITTPPLKGGGLMGLGKTEKFTTLEEAQKLAQKTDGSEAIVKHETPDGTFYTVHAVDIDDIQNFKDTKLEPNLMCFSVDPAKGHKQPEQIVTAAQMVEQNLNGFKRPELLQAKKDLDALFNAPIPLPEYDPSFGPKLLNRNEYDTLAQKFGFNDFADFELKTSLLSATAKGDLHCGIEALIRNADPMPAAVFNQFLKKSMQDQLVVARTLEVFPDISGTDGSTVLKKFENAFDWAMAKSLPGQTMTPALRDQLSKNLGFRDFSAFQAALGVLSESQRLSLLTILTDPSKISVNDTTGKVDCSQASHEIAVFLNKEIEAMINPVADHRGMGLLDPRPRPEPLNLVPPGNEWSAGAMMALYDAFQKIKTQSPDQLVEASKLTYNYDATPPNQDRLKENPAENNIIDLLTGSMFIAHTEKDEHTTEEDGHTVIIHEGAIIGSGQAVIEANAQMISEKMDFLQREIGSASVYRPQELVDRDLLDADGKFQRDNAVALFNNLTQQDASAPSRNATREEQTAFNQLYALVYAAGAAGADLASLFPHLVGIFEQDANGKLLLTTKSLENLGMVFFGNQGHDSTQIKALQGDVTKLMGPPPSAKLSDAVLGNAVFMAEKMSDSRDLQQFLNQINPEGAQDLYVDGILGDKSSAAIERLQYTVMAKLLESKLPPYPNVETKQAMTTITTLLSQEPLDTKALQLAFMGLVSQGVPGLTTEQNQSLKNDLMPTLNSLKEGKFDQATVQALLSSWLQMVDGNREGNIGSDLLIHEIGHNIMHEKTEPHGDQPAEFPTLESDWAAIGGFENSTGAFSLEKATESFLTVENEEVSDYGQTNAGEDFAEAFRLYNSDPKKLLAESPTKFLVLNAMVNDNPIVAQQKLDKLLNELQKDGVIKDTQTFLKPSLDKLLGYDPNAKSFVSPQMVAKMTQTYPSQFAGYVPPASNQAKINVSTEKLSPQQVADIGAAVKILVQHLPAPVGAQFDEAKLKALLGAECYNRLPESFKVMLSNQDSSPLTAYLVQPTIPLYSPELMVANMVAECESREKAQQNPQNYEELTTDELPDFQYGLKDEGAIDSLLQDVKTGTASGNLLKVIDKLNMIILYHNKTHLAPKGAMVDIHSPELEAFLTQLPNIDLYDVEAVSQLVKTTFDLQ